MDRSPTAGTSDYAGVFLIALATLMLEVLLTRIFSVTLWHHLAFVAVSIAMFGMTMGAVLVYLLPRWFTPARTHLNLAVNSALFGITAVWAVDVHLRSAVNAGAITSPLTQLSFTYGIIAIPFVFSGIAIAIALTQFPSQTSRLYAADLAGAALGCVLLIPVLEAAGGPRTVEVAAAAAGLASLAFLYGMPRTATPRRPIVAGGMLAGLAITFAFAMGAAVRDVGYAKTWNVTPAHEKWNSYSRIAVAPPRHEPPFGWGMSETFSGPTINQLRLNIDGAAETVMTEFHGNFDEVRHLRYDITNIGHYLTDNGRVFVIGAGGGRDVLSALVFGQRDVVAVEMNRAIIEAVNEVFGDVTGHLDRRENVRFVNDEARSYLARTPDAFDLIQISLIDTWAATAAGAFVLSENTLYTSDAWQLFFDRLTPAGILSVSRWHDRPVPTEMYKVVALATNSLHASGVASPRQHIMVVATSPRAGEALENPDTPAVATLLMKKTPFTDAEIATIERVAATMKFEVVLTPRAASDAAFLALSDVSALDAFTASFAFGDLTSPTDDRPFFFRMDASLLTGLFTVVALLTLAFIVVPVLLNAEPRVLRDHLGLSLAFAAIGLGFMLVEIAQMQRLILLLGHPTFSLSVVLFALLVTSGLGSFATRDLGNDDPHHIAGLSSAARTRMLMLLGILVVIGFLTPIVTRALQGSGTPIRIAAALLLLMPAGFFMGMAFPIAMKIGLARQPSITPWLWGINGAMSVTASVLAVMISSAYGISAAWWTGVACYVVATLAIVQSAKPHDF